MPEMYSYWKSYEHIHNVKENMIMKNEMKDFF